MRMALRKVRGAKWHLEKPDANNLLKQRDELLEALEKIHHLSRDGQELTGREAVSIIEEIQRQSRTAIVKARGAK